MSTTFKLLTLLAFAFAGLVSTASAGVVTWTTTDLFAGGDNDAFVSTNGTGVLAFNGSNSTANTVTSTSGVVFSGVDEATALAGFTQNGVTFQSTAPSTGNLSSFGDGDFTGGNAGDLVQGAIFNVPDFTLSGLTPGDEYEIQLIINDSRGNGGRDTGSWQVGLNDGVGSTVAVLGSLQGPPTRNNGDFFTGTFEADASGDLNIILTATRTGNISIGDDITVVPNGGQRQINAFQLRNITEPIPEPSSLALLGLATTGLLARRRR